MMRPLLIALAAGLVPLGLSLAPQPDAPASPAARAVSSEQPLAHSILGVAITVSDLDRSIKFYSDVLGFSLVNTSESSGPEVEALYNVFGARVLTADLRLGRESIQLNQFLAPEGRSIPEDFRSNDLAFQHIAIVVRDIDRAYQHLRQHNVRHASTGPQHLPLSNPNAGGIAAFYFKDPDGHVLEVISFPQGKGDPRWQEPSDQLFLGIDHTAIVVENTERSLSFYRDVLGMHIAGTSDNVGVEQEHLNNVKGAHLRITALRAQSGPGVEFLQYLTPRTGRPYPTDAAPNDQIHWHTIVSTTLSAPEVARRLRAADVGLVSDDSSQPTPDAPAILVRDPDGHQVLVQSGHQ